MVRLKYSTETTKDYLLVCGVSLSLKNLDLKRFGKFKKLLISVLTWPISCKLLCWKEIYRKNQRTVEQNLIFSTSYKHSLQKYGNLILNWNINLEKFIKIYFILMRSLFNVIFYRNN